jgi:hypothetical protein
MHHPAASHFSNLSNDTRIRRIAEVDNPGAVCTEIVGEERSRIGGWRELGVMRHSCGRVDRDDVDELAVGGAGGICVEHRHHGGAGGIVMTGSGPYVQVSRRLCGFRPGCKTKCGRKCDRGHKADHNLAHVAS